MSKQLGDFRRGATLDFKFVTTTSAGVPTTLGGTPAISVYKGNSVTQSTAGVTLSVDFDSVTGLNNVRIVTTDAFYDPLADYQVVITTGTVGGVSVVGYVVAEFSIENRFAGEVERGTAQGGGVQQITLAAAASATDDTYNGYGIRTRDGTGEQQWNDIVDYVGATRVATLSRTWGGASPDNTTVYDLYPGVLPSTLAETADAVIDEALSGHSTAGTVGKALTDIETKAIAAADLTSVVEGSLTLKGVLRLALAALSGKSTGGGKTFRDVADAKNRIVATTDGSGNRTAVTLDVTD